MDSSIIIHPSPPSIIIYTSGQSLQRSFLAHHPIDFIIHPLRTFNHHVYLRPKLTEKLLSKPPFRFLHDVITNLIHGSGFAEGLYTPEEMESGKLLLFLPLPFRSSLLNVTHESVGWDDEKKDAELHVTSLLTWDHPPPLTRTANVQEKQQKIEYLDKIINCVGICLGCE